MAKVENCVVCGLAPCGEGRPNGCAGNCEVPEAVQEEEAVVEEVVEKVEKPKKKATPKKKAAKKA